MKKLVLAVVMLLGGAAVLTAQTRKVLPEIRPFAGISIPTGDQRDFFKDAPLFGLQAAAEIKPYLHAVGTLGWTPAQDRYQLAADNVNILQYNVGLELGPVQAVGNNWQFMPFIGVGGGARTYLYQATGLSDKTCTAGYAAVGGEFKLGAAGLRLEARDNLFCYRSPIAGFESKTRNEVGVSLGVAYHIR